MAENNDADKTEPATEYKLREAKKQGNVAKSMEFNAWILLVLGFSALVFGLTNVFTLVGEVLVFMLGSSSGMDMSVTVMEQLFAHIVVVLIKAFFPLILVLVIAAIVSNTTQIGLIFSGFPLKPDPKRLNPVEGFKKLFSKKTLFEFAKTLLKFAILGATLVLVIQQVIQQVPLLYSLPASQVGGFIWQHLLVGGYTLLAVWAFIAILDLVYTRQSYAKKMRMSMRDIKDEHKKREGDPQIKQKRREIQRELHEKLKSLGNVPKADIVITNPTHFAVALRYQDGADSAPMILALGESWHAKKIKVLAHQNRVLTVENKPLARRLIKSGALNQPIPAECFAQVAQLYIQHGLISRG